MSSPFQERIEQAQAEFERSQAAIAGLQQELAGSRTTVTSKNRALSITLDSQGELAEIKFLTRSYRTMPSVELAQLLVDTVGEARRKALSEMAARFQSVLPAGAAVLDMINGTVDFDQMMREAIRDAAELRPSGPAANVDRQRGEQP